MKIVLGYPLTHTLSPGGEREDIHVPPCLDGKRVSMNPLAPLRLCHNQMGGGVIGRKRTNKSFFENRIAEQGL